MAARTGNSALIGRKPEPTALKLVRGVRPSRINLDAVEPELAMPPKPAGLTPAVSAAWDEVAASIAYTRVTVADGRAVRAFCEAAIVLDDLYALFHESGAKAVIRGRAGEIIGSPILAAIDRARTAMATAAREIGATPATRSAVRVPPKAADEFSQFLDRPAKAARPRGRAS